MSKCIGSSALAPKVSLVKSQTLTPFVSKLIIKEAQKLLDDKIGYEKMSKAHNPYGDGKACKYIIDSIKNSRI